jgi:serine O-acetyltransferase
MLKQTVRRIVGDLMRYHYVTGAHPAEVLLLNPGFQATMVYRLRHGLRQAFPRTTLWTLPIYVAQAVLGRVAEIVSGNFFDPRTRVGERFFLAHSMSTYIGKGVTIGDNCHILHEVTLGGNGVNGSKQPTLGDRVFVGAGAKIIGDITIGDDVVVGTNAVVTRSVPSRAVVVGIPARVVSFDGSFEIIRYPGFKDDPNRLESLLIRESGIERVAAPKHGVTVR